MLGKGKESQPVSKLQDWFEATSRDYNHLQVDTIATVRCRCGQCVMQLSPSQESTCSGCHRTYRYNLEPDGKLVLYTTGGPLSTDRRLRDMAEKIDSLLDRITELENK